MNKEQIDLEIDLGSFDQRVGAFKSADDINGGKELAHRIGKMWDEAFKE